ncbi:thioesterase domain-containing protein [Microbulbifer sp. SA54]|uniref:thioesterase domain-containing protein n=1 Tax=Microbulbifer sp. SA54 TaxID=3401577 RepID=UPI003AAC834A
MVAIDIRDDIGTPVVERESGNSMKTISDKSLVLDLDKKPSEGRVPIYMISGIGGHVMSSQLIARGISEKWKAYGLLHPVFTGYEYSTIEDNARILSEHLVQAQSLGPYNLIGYSMGGLIAIEMGRLLSEQGLDVRVVLLDTKPPQLPPLKPPIVRLSIYLRWYLKKYGNILLNRKCPDDGNGANITYDQHKSIPNLPKAFRKAFQLGREAVDNYVATPCPLPSVLVRSEQVSWWENLREWTSDYGWASYIDLKQVIFCPGGHLDLVKADQYWQSTGAALEEALTLLEGVQGVGVTGK